MQKISDMTAPIFPAAREVVFIDSRVQDLHTILAALRPGVQAVVLNDHEDGAAQMARALQGEQSLASISVVSHGDAGVLLLGKGRCLPATWRSTRPTCRLWAQHWPRAETCCCTAATWARASRARRLWPRWLRPGRRLGAGSGQRQH